MEQRTGGEIVIGVLWRAVLETVLDVEAYPTWASQFTSAEVMSRDARGWPERAELVMDAGPVKDSLLLRYTVDVGASAAVVSWQLERAQQLAALDGAYALTALSDESTHVRYEVRVDPGLPLLTALRRKAERVVVETALTDLRNRLEAGRAV